MAAANDRKGFAPGATPKWASSIPDGVWLKLWGRSEGGDQITPFEDGSSTYQGATAEIETGTEAERASSFLALQPGSIPSAVLFSKRSIVNPHILNLGGGAPPLAPMAEVILLFAQQYEHTWEYGKTTANFKNGEFKETFEAFLTDNRVVTNVTVKNGMRRVNSVSGAQLQVKVNEVAVTLNRLDTTTTTGASADDAAAGGDHGSIEAYVIKIAGDVIAWDQASKVSVSDNAANAAKKKADERMSALGALVAGVTGSGTERGPNRHRSIAASEQTVTSTGITLGASPSARASDGDGDGPPSNKNTRQALAEAFEETTRNRNLLSNKMMDMLEATASQTREDAVSRKRLAGERASREEHREAAKKAKLNAEAEEGRKRVVREDRNTNAHEKMATAQADAAAASSKNANAMSALVQHVATQSATQAQTNQATMNVLAGLSALLGKLTEKLA